MKDALLPLFLLALYVGFYGFLILGWIFGLVNFVNCDFEAPYKCEVIYGVGTVTGLNSFLGWFNFGK